MARYVTIFICWGPLEVRWSKKTNPFSQGAGRQRGTVARAQGDLPMVENGCTFVVQRPYWAEGEPSEPVAVFPPAR
ncbi:hypothetical protein CIK75_10950 [Glutamicibacter sp. BW78]|nr:hypothetical protein CIK75_10950 [Glutamicibacter sp. BW78]